VSPREKLADLAHEQWSGWMRYMLPILEPILKTREDHFPDEVPERAFASLVRWKRQLSTPYADLPENEKESDRVEADKVLALIETETQRELRIRKRQQPYDENGEPITQAAYNALLAQRNQLLAQVGSLKEELSLDRAEHLRVATELKEARDQLDYWKRVETS
jgi:hypothetical protein